MNLKPLRLTPIANNKVTNPKNLESEDFSTCMTVWQKFFTFLRLIWNQHNILHFLDTRKNK
jgi:hypothetical protein